MHARTSQANRAPWSVQLPVLARINNEGVISWQIMFAAPLTRILEKECVPSSCSDTSPIQFDIGGQLSLCQTSKGTIICNTTLPLDPSVGLVDKRLETLDSSQTRQGMLLSSALKHLINEQMTKNSYHSLLSGVTTYNSNLCAGSMFCTQAELIPSTWRREINRQSSGVLAFLFDNNDLWNFFSAYITLWGIYVNINGFLHFLVRLRVYCSRNKVARFGCLSTLLSLFSELDLSLNPSSFLRQNQKVAVAQLTAQQVELTMSVESLTRTLKSLNEEFSSMKSDMQELVGEYARVKKEFGEQKFLSGEPEKHKDQPLAEPSIYNTPRPAENPTNNIGTELKLPLTAFVAKTTNFLKSAGATGYGFLTPKPDIDSSGKFELTDVQRHLPALPTIAEESVGLNPLYWPYYSGAKRLTSDAESLYWECLPASSPLIAPPLPARPNTLKEPRSQTPPIETETLEKPEERDLLNYPTIIPRKPPRLYTTVLNDDQEDGAMDIVADVIVHGGVTQLAHHDLDSQTLEGAVGQLDRV